MRTVRWGMLLVFAGAAALGGAAAAPRMATSAHTVAQATVPPQATPQPEPTRQPAPRAHRGRHAAVTLAFGGDVHFEGTLRAGLAADPATVLAAAAPLFAGADISMVNLETAVATGGKPQPKLFTFRAPPSAFDALRAARVDIVTMANNHGLDFGPAALEESLAAAADAGFPLVGAGRDAHEAYRPYVFSRNGERIAILAATQVLDPRLQAAWTATDTKPGLASAKPAHLPRLLAAVRAARRSADTVVVYLHWGRELQPCPTHDQRALAHALVAAGADVIVGSHAHVLLGRGFRGRAFVDYGLGNFAFYARRGITTHTGALIVRVRGHAVVATAWRPARIQAGVPRGLAPEAAAPAAAAAAALRACTDLAAEPAA